MKDLPVKQITVMALLLVCIVTFERGMAIGAETSGASLRPGPASATTNLTESWTEVSRLARELGDADPRVRFSAAEALWKMGPKCEPALQELIDHIDDEEWALFENPRRGGEVRAMVDRAIGQIAEGVVPRLIACLDSPKPVRRRNAAVLLGSRNDPEAVKPLIALLKDGDRLVRARVAEALGSLGRPEAAVAVASVLNDSDSYVRSRAAYALGGMKSVEVLPQLIAALGDRDEGVRQYAALSLGIIGDKGAVDALGEVAKSDSSRGVRAAAKDAVRRIHSTKVRQNQASDGTARKTEAPQH